MVTAFGSLGNTPLEPEEEGVWWDDEQRVAFSSVQLAAGRPGMTARHHSALSPGY